MTRLDETLKHPDLIYDVGMHKGEDSQFYLNKGFRVVAFEANPELVRLCTRRFQSFIDQGRMTIVEGAIVSPESIEAGQKKVRFYKNDEMSVWGTVSPDWADRNVRLGTSSSVLEVDAVDFPGVIRRYGVPHFMKVDIEGQDVVCVKAFGSFRERPDFISIESDKTNFRNLSLEIEQLQSLGYNAFQAVEQSGIPDVQSPPVPATEGVYVPHRFDHGASGLFGSELPNGWKSRSEILRQYRLIHFGYRVVGDDGVLSRSKFPGSEKLKYVIRGILKAIIKAPVPGWYDTHARHSSVRPVTSRSDA